MQSIKMSQVSLAAAAGKRQITYRCIAQSRDASGVGGVAVDMGVNGTGLGL
jgi:hypothetical protein